MATTDYKKLSKKWIAKHKKLQKEFVDKHKEHLENFQNSQKKLAVGSMAGVMLLSQPVTTSLMAQALPHDKPIHETEAQKGARFAAELSGFLPQEVQPLTPEQETVIADTLSNHFGIKVVPELDGKRLNRSYGVIGAEQHLMRYPGDTMASHFDNPEDSQKYYSSGMAPGRGAWGYFANSRGEMSEQDVLNEKYYIAVPTFLSPGWKDNVKDHYGFFKNRKMLVVNPQNGKAIVADIADAGPAQWTGKHLGGSPEVMKYLERVDGRARGPVLYFFIDESQSDKPIPLGPVQS